MAEPTLTLDWSDLKTEVARYLSYPSTLSTDQTTTVESIVQSGYRRVLYPPAFPGVEAGYSWTFLRPTTTLTITADDGDYDLPDDYARIVGSFHYAPDDHLPEIVQVPLSSILDSRASTDQNFDPYWFAIRFKTSDQSAGQKQEVLFYPEPSEDRTLYYSYEAMQNKLGDTYPYPLGGATMSELYKQSCIAVAEQRHHDEIGIQHQMFVAMLQDMIARDKKRAPAVYGFMGDQDGADASIRRGRGLYNGAYSITYKGSQI